MTLLCTLTFLQRPSRLGGHAPPDHEAPVYLAVHPAQATLLNDEVTGRLQEVGAEVTLLDVIVLIPAVSGPGPGPDGGRSGSLSIWDGTSASLSLFLTTLSTHERWRPVIPAPASAHMIFSFFPLNSFFLRMQVNILCCL